MGGLDWLILGLLGFAVGLALARLRRHKGGCHGNCANCTGCSRRKPNE